jgi:hypothetical protein
VRAKLQARVRGELKWLPLPLTPHPPTLNENPQPPTPTPTPNFQGVDLASIPYLVMMEEHGIKRDPKGTAQRDRLLLERVSATVRGLHARTSRRSLGPR